MACHGPDFSRPYLLDSLGGFLGVVVGHVGEQVVRHVCVRDVVEHDVKEPIATQDREE